MSSGNPLLLDTHYWIRLQLGINDGFTPRVLRAVEQAAHAGRLLISVISAWELGMLEAKGRIQLQMSCEQWVKEALATPGLSVAPLTPEIAVESSRLPGTFHGDAADRMIVATARGWGATLLTQDKKLLAYGRQRHVRLLQ